MSSKARCKKILLYIVLALLTTLVPFNAFAASGISEQGAKKQIQNNNITRAELFSLINNIFGYHEKAAIHFSDVSGSAWYYEEIAKAVAAGYVAGYPDGTIKPQAYITRQEAAVVVATAFGLKNKTSLSFSQFKDYGQIQNWAKSYVAVMKDKGFIGGYPDGTFGPRRNMKRSEATSILNSASGNVVKQSGAYSKEAKGNLVVNVGNVTLKNMTIAGDLYLAEGIGDGEVTMDGVSVKGKTIVRGGGENSVILRNTALADIEVNKPKGSGQPVRLVSEGNTSVSGTVTVNSGVKLEENNLSQGATGFSNILVSDKLPETAKVVFSGDFKEVTLTSKQGIIEISKDATVSTVTVQAAAKVVIAEGAKVSTVAVTETAQGANIEAKADVKVQVKAKNVTVNNTIVDTGSTANISSGGNTTISATTNTGGSTGNGGGSSTGSDDDGSDDSGSSITETGVTLAIPNDGILPYHFDVVVRNVQTNALVTGLAAGDFLLTKGQINIPLNIQAFRECLSEDPQNNVPGRYTIYPVDEYRPMTGLYTLTFSKTGYTTATVTFDVTAPNAIQGANVDITTGSAVFNYEFYGTDQSVITYEQALTEPYNLSLAASTVRLEMRSGETVTHATYNIKLDTLNITSAGTVRYVDVDAVETAFGNPDFMNVWQGPPTHIVLVLKGGLGENAWELDPITIQFEQSDMDAFGSIMSPTGGGGSPGAFIPGEGGNLPVFTAFSGEPDKIGGLYIDRSHSENNVFGGGNRPVVEFGFKPPQEYGATSFTMQYSDDNGSTWQNYQYSGVDLTTTTASQDNFSINPAGSYKYRLLVNGGEYNGYTSNEVEAPLSALATAFSGWHLDESMTLTGVIAPYVGCGKAASFDVVSLSDGSGIQGYLSYQWYRVNPKSFEMTPIPGAISLTYTTTPADAGYYLICRAAGDGENVGGFAQIISYAAPVIPNKAYVTDVTSTGFKLNLYQSISRLTPEDLKLYYLNETSQPVDVSITSVTQIENNAVFEVSAEIPDGVTSLRLEDTSPFWEIITDSGQNHMLMQGVEISIVG